MLESLNYRFQRLKKKNKIQLLKENLNQKSTPWASPSLSYMDPLLQTHS